MRGAIRRRCSSLELVALALLGAGGGAFAQTDLGVAFNERGEIVATWDLDPAATATCIDRRIPWVFGDDYETGSSCAWSGRSGSDEECALCGDGVASTADNEECDDGNLDPTDGCTDSCQYARCGDGVQWDGVEACDEPGLPTSTCDADCSLPSCGDGLLNAEAGEECDDGNLSNQDACVSCEVASCGDGYLWNGREACDPAIDPSTCYANCTESFCGDGIVFPSAGEACDDGNQVTESQCPYGTAFCTSCKADCSSDLQLLGPFCGDGAVSVSEACDDGNTITETACPYGDVSCQVCDSSCTLVARTGAVCGDGTVNFPFEDCDDGNASSCGTCSTDCRSPRPPLSATGMLIVPPGAAIQDGDYFVLEDAGGNVAELEFDRAGDGVSPGRFAVAVTGASTESQVRNACVAAIEASGIGLEASIGGSQVVALVQLAAGSFGNAPISEFVGSASFVAFGMSGGQAADCPIGEACVSGSDCQSGVCNLGMCESP